MKMSTTGVIAGSVIGAIGLTYAMRDRRTRNKLMKDSKKIMAKAGQIMDKMDIF